MIRTALFTRQKSQTAFGGQELLEEWASNTDSVLWLDVEDESDELVRDLLSSRFGISDFAIDDAFRQRHPPKIEQFNTYIFLLVRGLDAQTTDIYYNTIQLAFFAGRNYFITYRRKESRSIDRVWTKLEAGEVSMKQGSIYMACKVLRAVVDRYTPVLLNLERRLEEMEDELFLTTDDSLLEELVDYNSKLKKMRRTLTYHCNLLLELKRVEAVESKTGIRHIVNDVYEQFDRLNSLSNLYQELVVDLMNGYLSLSTHRLNQVMKVLTIVTVVFLPLTIMVGIYGMNFTYMPELQWRYGYFTILGAMVIVVIISFSILKYKKWW